MIHPYQWQGIFRTVMPWQFYHVKDYLVDPFIVGVPNMGKGKQEQSKLGFRDHTLFVYLDKDQLVFQPSDTVLPTLPKRKNLYPYSIPQ